MYDRPHFYLSFGGTLFPAASGHEEWQTGLKFAGVPEADVDDYLFAQGNISLVDILQDCTDLIKDGYAMGCSWSNVVSIDWVKLAVLDTNGEYAGAATVAEQTGKFGGFGAFPFAPQLASCVSFWSGSTFGYANRGRMYLPVPMTLLNSITVSEPRASQVQADLLRDIVKMWMNAVTGEMATVPLNVYPAIMSKLGTGHTKPITKIGTGRVIDTIRSRRHRLDESPVWVDR